MSWLSRSRQSSSVVRPAARAEGGVDGLAGGHGHGRLSVAECLFCEFAADEPYRPFPESQASSATSPRANPAGACQSPSLPVDVERLGVERHVGEQHVVHLRHRAGQRVLVEMPNHEIVEIDAAALVADHGFLRHRGLP